MPSAASRRADYAFLTAQATLDETGSLAKPRAILLLWFLRNVVGIGDLDAYDHVCDGDNDKGIDGLFVELSATDDTPDTLVIYQSKYGESEDSMVGAADIDRLDGAAGYFRTTASLDALLTGQVEQSLRRLVETLSIRERLASAAGLQVRLVLVTSGELHPDAKRKVELLRAEHGVTYVDVWDLDRLGPVARAVRSPERIGDDIEIDFATGEVVIVGVPPNRVAVIPVTARQIALWPGIDSRELFALNVRHELRTNRVSKGLDGAIRRPDEHQDFLAYHNGLTVICDTFDLEAARLIVHGPSVVNGAQSVLAFARGNESGTLTDSLRVFVKVVEVSGRPLLEKEVSRRSNTQTGVNPRNLMANSGPQLRIQREFDATYREIFYETRPDTIAPDGRRTVANDFAAQLLCAIYNEQPWLAVKKNTLFESEHHPQIFSDRVTAQHVMFCIEVNDAVERQRDNFPDEYRTSWQLTRLIACYLVGKAARDSADLATFVTDPQGVLDRADLNAQLDDLAFVAAETLRERNTELGEADDFKTDFKNEGHLLSLAAAAVKTYRLSERFKERGR